MWPFMIMWSKDPVNLLEVAQQSKLPSRQI